MCKAVVEEIQKKAQNKRKVGQGAFEKSSIKYLSVQVSDTTMSTNDLLFVAKKNPS
jgi:hypothetical protein